MTINDFSLKSILKNTLLEVLPGLLEPLKDSVKVIADRVGVLSDKLGKIEGEIQGDIRMLGEGIYERFDKIERKVDLIKDSLDLKSKAGNEGFNLEREKNGRVHGELFKTLGKHQERIASLERITGNIKEA